MTLLYDLHIWFRDALRSQMGRRVAMICLWPGHFSGSFKQHWFEQFQKPLCWLVRAWGIYYLAFFFGWQSMNSPRKWVEAPFSIRKWLHYRCQVSDYKFLLGTVGVGIARFPGPCNTPIACIRVYIYIYTYIHSINETTIQTYICIYIYVHIYIIIYTLCIYWIPIPSLREVWSAWRVRCVCARSSRRCGRWWRASQRAGKPWAMAENFP